MSIFSGYDFIFAIITLIAGFLLLPQFISMKFALSFYNTTMTILSIIFSLFFAAMAILMSSSDNDFIEFLEENNDFTELLWSFKFTLGILFISLILSIFLYFGTSYWLETYDKDRWLQSRWMSIILLVVFIYGMISTWLAILDIVKFSDFRARFLKKQSELKKKEKEKAA